MSTCLLRTAAFVLLTLIALALPVGGQAQAPDATAAPASVVPRAVEKRFITISTGGFFGVYYPLSSSICKIVNQHSAKTQVYCSIRRSSGAIMNVDRMRRNEVNFAIVSSDALRLAIGGSNRFYRPDPFTGLRGVLTLYNEQIAVLAGKSVPDAKSFLDFKGRTLTIGPANSDGAIAYTYLAQAYGMSDGDFKALLPTEESHQLDGLCSGDSDGLVFVGGSPNEMVERALDKRCGARLLMLEPGTRAGLIQRQPQFTATEIPGGIYASQPIDVPTVGTEAVLVTHDAVPPGVITALVQAVLAEMPTLRRAHRVMTGKRREDLLPRIPFLPNAPEAVAALSQEAPNGK